METENFKNYEAFVHGNYEEGTRALRFIDLIYVLKYNLTKQEANLLLSFFLNEDNYEVLESVVQELRGMTDKKILVESIVEYFF